MGIIMAKAAAPEIDKAELKKLLTRSKKDPVNCAVGLAADGSAVIMLDKIKNPRAVLKKMEDEYGDIKNGRWGTAEVDTDVDAKLVVLTINKTCAGIARKLKKTLKGTGFAKVRVMLEGGGVDEEDMEDEEQDTAASPSSGPATAAAEDGPAPASSSADAPEPAPSNETQPTAAPAAAEAPAAPAGVDFKALAAQLSVQVRKMIAFIDDKEKFKLLRAMADKAQAAIKAAQDEAVSLVQDLEIALEGGSSAPAATSSQPEPNQSVEPAPANMSTEPAPAATTQSTQTSSESGVDFKALTAQLTDLVKKMIAIKASNPERFAQLKAMADKASAAIKASNDEAVELTYELGVAIEGGAEAVTSETGAAPAEGTAQAAEPHVLPAEKKAALAAGPKIWDDAVSSINSALERLQDTIRKEFASEGPDVVADIEKNLQKITDVTKQFEGKLADYLREAHDATDAASHNAAIKSAKAAMSEHMKYVASDPVIKLLDENPFGVPTDIKKTMADNLKQLIDAVR